MAGTVDSDTTAAVERLRAELPAAIAARRADEVAYFGPEGPVPDPHDLGLRIDVRDDGMPDPRRSRGLRTAHSATRRPSGRSCRA